MGRYLQIVMVQKIFLLKVPVSFVECRIVDFLHINHCSIRNIVVPVQNNYDFGEIWTRITHTITMSYVDREPSQICEMSAEVTICVTDPPK